ncbi:Crp/Fnr family transcriptional regulator [Bradyrhizobium sp. ORS 111]|uniref:Crp/Fnr family transcriptional regulator n=1 Tax=Bradyrhizobium sp. ORS 111 TaxID=1685958 RepID=UPI00388EC2BA
MLLHWRRPTQLRNHILAGLPPDDLAYIRPLLEPVVLKERSVLQEPVRRIEYVDFVETGIISLMTLARGSVLETAMVGSQGFTPVSVALGAPASEHRSVVLVSGTASRIGADALRRTMCERPQIREQLLRYVQSVMTHGSQIGLCGVWHRLEQRLACWLCLACDAIESNVLPVTHDNISAVLGLRRAGITEALNRFEEEGLVSKMRGLLEIRDAAKLRQKACCCYGTIAAAYGRARTQ